MSLPSLLNMVMDINDPTLGQDAERAITQTGSTSVASGVTCYGYSSGVRPVDTEGVEGEIVDWDIVTQYPITSKKWLLSLTDDGGTHVIRIKEFNGISAKGGIPGFYEITGEEYIQYDN